MIPIYGTKISIPEITVFEEFIWNYTKYKLLKINNVPFCYYPEYLNEKCVIIRFFYKYMNYQEGYACFGSKYVRSINLSRVLPEINLKISEKFDCRKFEPNQIVDKTYKIERYRLEELWYDNEPFIWFYVLSSMKLKEVLEILKENYVNIQQNL
ncbi:MAG: hypothetical protein ACFFG0_37320 [Candidatus Thorarchaeota archaeon]